MPFTEIVTGPRAEAERVFAETGLVADPPEGLAALIAWETGSDELTTVMVWATPGARGDFAAERMMPLLEDGTFRPSSPERLHPTHLFVRDVIEPAVTS